MFVLAVDTISFLASLYFRMGLYRLTTAYRPKELYLNKNPYVPAANVPPEA